ncbi:MAG TPA: MBL fold metallo-hydrolase [Pyrinomonadaceae bacterium]|nr:MBL fold metallo-hydrolase [Pyrinomonadaceae bacterium]
MQTLVSFFLILLLATVTSANPEAKYAAQDQQAQQTLESALQAFGGLERLRSLNSLFFKGKGSEFRSADLQGPDPSTPVRAFHEETTAAFPSQEKILYEHRTGRHDGSFRWRRWMYAGEERTVIDMQDDLISQLRRDPNAATERARIARTIPHLLLLEAAGQEANLRWIGKQNYAGKQHNVIGFPLPNSKTTLALFFATDTHLLSKYEYAMDFPGLGDTLVEFVYTSYRRDPKLGHAPTGYKILVGGNTYREIELTEVEADSSKTATAFEISAQMKSYLMPLNEATQVAKGVYIFPTGGLNPMFVEFKDFILAVEAPAQHPTLERVPADTQAGSDQPSERFIQKIKETIPNKPIRYLAVTHFHSDHAGGARAFLAEGATLITTPGNKDYFEKLSAAKYTVVPDKLSRQTGPTRIETFDRKHVITDGERSVELINVGESPHAKENVIVYLPQEKILFQGDLFYYSGMAPFPAKDPSRDRVMKFFGEWLLKNHLEPAQIYGFHDRGFATMKQVRHILNLKRE